MHYISAFWELTRETFTEWNQDKAPLLAAAIAYYTAFAIAPLIIIVIAIIGLIANESQLQAEVIEQIENAMGADAANVVSGMIESRTNGNQGLIPSLISVGALLFGALGLFGNLQNALNIIWNVDQIEHENGIWRFVKDKLLSFGMILVIGFLLLVSLVLSTFLSMAHSHLFSVFAEAFVIMRLLNEVLAFVMTTLLIMAIYKLLPHAEIQWRDVIIGAAVTAFLFTIGRVLLSLYLGNTATASTYGAAGAFVVILLWVYYSAQIILFGAEFTQVFARRYGSRIVAQS